jgi:hypothetical protein
MGTGRLGTWFSGELVQGPGFCPQHRKKKLPMQASVLGTDFLCAVLNSWVPCIHPWLCECEARRLHCCRAGLWNGIPLQPGNGAKGQGVGKFGQSKSHGVSDRGGDWDSNQFFWEFLFLELLWIKMVLSNAHWQASGPREPTDRRRS